MMSYTEPDNDSTVEQLLGAIAILALLTAMFACGAYVARSDDRATRELAAQKCLADEVVFVKPDGSEVLCMGGSGRARR